MLAEYLGLAGMLGVGIGTACGLYLLANRLRAKIDSRAPAAGVRDGSAATGQVAGAGQRSSRYFLVAIVGLMLHAGSFYFYLWGAAVREVGLTGLVVMLGFGMCLVVGVFYSWARGAISYAVETVPEDHPD